MTIRTLAGAAKLRIGNAPPTIERTRAAASTDFVIAQGDLVRGQGTQE
jgi:hypothetical protein